MRLLRHPGPYDPVRLESAVEASGRAVRIAFPAGQTLLAGVSEALAGLGIASGTMTLFGGTVRQLVYVLARPDPTGERAVALTDPIETSDVAVIAGGASVGLGPDGTAFIHCHGLFADAAGEGFGGHLFNDRTVMGEGAVAYVRGFSEISVEVIPDAEIGVAIFRPTRSERPLRSDRPTRPSLPPSDGVPSAMDTAAPHHVETGRIGRIAYTHVRPNEDLVQAVQKVALMHGFRAAFVRGTLGSLTDACLAAPDGALREIRGPAIEVLAIAGEVRSDADGVPRAHLSGAVADTEGRVFGGRFVSGRNPVCMTFELVLEEWLPDAGTI
ncbi:PCC domain-containing protein [Enterovirga rhinocerotis]|uniref:PCC domain-containing protein n=1 Tax=Enterovirga rhinocerotis TaxID=1339210 RepID=UPI00315CB3EF